MSRATLEELRDRVMALEALVGPYRKLATTVRAAMRQRAEKSQVIDPAWVSVMQEVSAAEHAAGVIDPEQPQAPEPPRPSRPVDPPPYVPLPAPPGAYPRPPAVQPRPLLGAKTGLLSSGGGMGIPSRMPLVVCPGCSSTDIDGESDTVFGARGVINARLRCRGCGRQWTQVIQAPRY